MKSILITGINSFTGNYLSGLLKRKGYNVYGSVYKKQDESIKNNYFQARKNQTLDFVKKMHHKYLKFNHKIIQSNFMIN